MNSPEIKDDFLHVLHVTDLGAYARNFKDLDILNKIKEKKL